VMVSGLALIGRRDEAASYARNTETLIERGMVCVTWAATSHQIAGIATGCACEWDASEAHFQKALEVAATIPCMRSKRALAFRTPTCFDTATVPAIASSRVCSAAKPNPWRQRWAQCSSSNGPETCGTRCRAHVLTIARLQDTSHRRVLHSGGFFNMPPSMFSISTGSGKTIVEFFSDAISVSVCR